MWWIIVSLSTAVVGICDEEFIAVTTITALEKSSTHCTFPSKDEQRCEPDQPSDPTWRKLVLQTALLREPTLIRGWDKPGEHQVKELLNPDFLEAQFPWVLVSSQQQGVFATFHDDKPMEPLLKNNPRTAHLTWASFNTLHNISSSWVLRNLTFPEQPLVDFYYFNYFSSRLSYLDRNSSQSHRLGVQSLAGGGPRLDLNLTRLLSPFTMSYMLPLPVSYPSVSPAAAALNANALENDVDISKGTQVNLWLSRSGITTHTHYDAQHNFFYLVSGSKTFTLIPPHHPSIVMYPCIHPFYAHVQPAPNSEALPSRRFTRTGSERNLSCAPIYKTTLRAGEMLYVPPFWLHHVDTEEPTIALNIWSNAFEYELSHHIYTLPLPFESEWPLRKRVLATHYFMCQVISLLGGKISKNEEMESTIQTEETMCAEFVQEWVLNRRYGPLVQSGELPINTKVMDKFNFSGHFSEPLLEYPGDLPLSQPGHKSFSSYPPLCWGGHKEMLLRGKRMFGDSFARGTGPVVAAFKRMTYRSLPIAGKREEDWGKADEMKHHSYLHEEEFLVREMEALSHSSTLNFSFSKQANEHESEQQDIARSIQSLLLGNYFEHVVNAVLGVKRVYPFLLFCFSQDN